jgi:hypothetical protein
MLQRPSIAALITYVLGNASEMLPGITENVKSRMLRDSYHHGHGGLPPAHQVWWYLYSSRERAWIVVVRAKYFCGLLFRFEHQYLRGGVNNRTQCARGNGALFTKR